MLGAGGVEVDVSVREGRGQRSCWVGLVGGGGVGGLKREREGGGGIVLEGVGGGGGGCVGSRRKRDGDLHVLVSGAVVDDIDMVGDVVDAGLGLGPVRGLR